MPLDRRDLRHFYVSTAVIPAPPIVLLLAGGQGTRLRQDPEFADVPKLMITDRLDAPMLENALADLAWSRVNMRRVALLTSSVEGAGAIEIEDYARTQPYNLDLQVIREDHALGTAGAVRAALVNVREPTLVVAPADTLFPYIELPHILDEHRHEGRTFTWAVTTRPGPQAQNAGRLRIDGQRLLHTGEADPDTPLPDQGTAATSAGVMVINSLAFRSYFDDYVAGLDACRPVDLYRDLVPWLLAQQHPVHVYDIGSPAPDLDTPERLRTFWLRDN